MASIKKRAYDYLITVSRGRKPDGKQDLAFTTYTPDPNLTDKKNLALCKQKASEFELEVKSPSYHKCSNKTYQAYIETEWLTDYCSGKMEQTTYELTEDILKRFVFPVIGYKKLTEINAKDIEMVYHKMIKDGYDRNGKHYEYAFSYIKRVHQVISSSFTKAFKWRYVNENPCRFVDLPKPKNADRKEILYFTVEQCQNFLEAIQKPYLIKHGARKHRDGTPSIIYRATMIPLQQRIFFFLAVIGGFRRSELVALTWDDIDFEKEEIHIVKAITKTRKGQITKSTKTKSSIRTVTIPAFIMDMLKEYKSQNAYEHLFIQADGKPMCLDTPSKTLNKVIRIYNENHTDKLPNVSVHGLRHTCATILINNGMNIKTVSTRLGHSEIRTTLNIYTHPLKSADKEASDKMASLLGY